MKKVIRASVYDPDLSESELFYRIAIREGPQILILSWFWPIYFEKNSILMYYFNSFSRVAGAGHKADNNPTHNKQRTLTDPNQVRIIFAGSDSVCRSDPDPVILEK